MDASIYAAQLEIPHCVLESVNSKEYVARALEYMRRDGAIKVFDEIYKSNSPLVVQVHLEEWDEGFSRRYKLHYQLTAVRSHVVTMPVFRFVNHYGEAEWKCSFCSTINNMKATFCGELHKNAVGCGHAREKTIQDYA